MGHRLCFSNYLHFIQSSGTQSLGNFPKSTIYYYLLYTPNWENATNIRHLFERMLFFWIFEKRKLQLKYFFRIPHFFKVYSRCQEVQKIFLASFFPSFKHFLRTFFIFIFRFSFFTDGIFFKGKVTFGGLLNYKKKNSNSLISSLLSVNSHVKNML